MCVFFIHWRRRGAQSGQIQRETLAERQEILYSHEESEEDLEDRPYCPMCEYIVGELDRYMTDNHTEEYIQETVEQICNMLRYV